MTDKQVAIKMCATWIKEAVGFQALGLTTLYELALKRADYWKRRAANS